MRIQGTKIMRIHADADADADADPQHWYTHLSMFIICTGTVLTFITSVAAGPPWGQPESSLSPSTWQGDPLLTPGPGEGDVITPTSWSMAGTTVASLQRGTGGF